MISRGYIINKWDLKKEKTELFRKHTEDALINRAAAIKHVPSESQTAIRQIFPEDLGLESWKVTNGDPWIKLTSSVSMAIFKVTQLSLNPSVSIMTFRTPSYVFYKFDLKGMYAPLAYLNKIHSITTLGKAMVIYDGISDLQMEAYFAEPIVIDPHCEFQIEVSPNDGDDELVLGGFVCEPRGTTRL